MCCEGNDFRRDEKIAVRVSYGGEGRAGEESGEVEGGEGVEDYDFVGGVCVDRLV